MILQVQTGPSHVSFWAGEKLSQEMSLRHGLKRVLKDFNGRSQTPIFVWILVQKCGIVGVAKEIVCEHTIGIILPFKFAQVHNLKMAVIHITPCPAVTRIVNIKYLAAGKAM